MAGFNKKLNCSTKYGQVPEMCEKSIGPPVCDVISAIVKNVWKFVASLTNKIPSQIRNLYQYTKSHAYIS